ncbi:MAG: Asp23/Gls24 family envelope stress response protein [Clostridiales bacterium]|nr:Asp23/Gls24 family envelope stress response protein [Clostridiales bacterium]
MARFKKLPVNVNEGKVVYGEGIVDNIVLLAVKEIPYVELYNQQSNDKMKNSSIKVFIEKDGVHVDVVVKIHYTQSVSDMAFKIQEAVRYSVESMTEYHIANVNVSIKGVMFEDKIDEKPVQKEVNQTPRQDEQQEGNQ